MGFYVTATALESTQHRVPQPARLTHFMGSRHYGHSCMTVRFGGTVRRIAVLVFLLVVCGGCRSDVADVESPKTKPHVESPESLEASIQARRVERDIRTAELREKLAMIEKGDGISKSEAEIIAEYYFHQNVGCGGFTGIRDGGDFWIVEGEIGIAANPIQGLRIEKVSGKFTSPSGPIDLPGLEEFP